MPVNTDRILPVHANPTPPKGAVAAGVTPTGKQLYRLERKMARSKPKLGPDGEQLFRRNPTTGEALPGMPRLREPELYVEEQLFYLESDGHNGIYKVIWTPPSEAELRAAERRQAIDAVKDQLAEALVDQGLSPAELIARIQGAPQTPAVPVPAPDTPRTAGDAASGGEPGSGAEPGAEVLPPIEPPDFDAFPKNVSPGKWELSDGSFVGGGGAQALKKEEALKAEEESRARVLALIEAQKEARANAEVTPEF